MADEKEVPLVDATCIGCQRKLLSTIQPSKSYSGKDFLGALRNILCRDCVIIWNRINECIWSGYDLAKAPEIYPRGTLSEGEQDILFDRMKNQKRKKND